MGEDAGFASTTWANFNQLAVAGACELLDDCAGVFVIDVDGGFFDWFHADTVFFANDHLLTGDRPLKAIAANVYDQNDHLQVATAGTIQWFASVGGSDFDPLT